MAAAATGNTLEAGIDSMSDPRTTTRQQRDKNGPSPLLRALRDPELEGANFCPFGCADGQLDVHGCCAHLVGFTNGGTSYEPRELDQFGRIFTNGANRQPLKRGMKLVRISVSARVYSPNPNPDLAVERESGDNETVRREDELLEAADRLRNPPLDGDWSEPTIYGDVPDVGEQSDGHEPPKARSKRRAELLTE